MIEQLVRALREGTVLDLDGAAISATLIRNVLLGRPPFGAQYPLIALTEIDPHGLRIAHAEITGQLDLNHAHVGPAVVITQSRLPDGITMQHARFDRELSLESSSLLLLNMMGAHIAGELNMRSAQLGHDQDGDSLIGDRGHIGGAVYLDEAFTATGAVRLTDAHIAGVLSMTGAQLTGNRNMESVVGDRLQVESTVLLNGGFTAAGTVRLPGAHIAGNLTMTDAQLNGNNESGSPLHCDGLQVDSDVFMDGNFTARGAIRLPGAHIMGQLQMRGAQLTGRDADGNSFQGDGLVVESDVFMDGGFTAKGAVRLPGAQITGVLSMTDARLEGFDRNDYSLAGNGLRVDSDVCLDGEFRAARTIGLRGARLGPLRLAAKALPVGTTDIIGLTLTGATVSDLELDPEGVAWFSGRSVQPNKSQSGLPGRRVVLSLENCSYPQRPPGKLESWLRILRFHTPDYEPRSYQQLAAVHRATGHDRDAGRILMAQQNHRRASALRPAPGSSIWQRFSLWVSRAGLAIWQKTLGYGYRPRYALLWLLAMLVVAGSLVLYATHTPADPANPDIPVAHRPADPEPAPRSNTAA